MPIEPTPGGDLWKSAPEPRAVEVRHSLAVEVNEVAHRAQGVRARLCFTVGEPSPELQDGDLITTLRQTNATLHHCEQMLDRLTASAGGPVL